MTILKPKLRTDSWISVTWDKYLQLCENPNYTKAKFYYNHGQARIEMSPLGNDHSRDHASVLGYYNSFNQKNDN